MKKVFAGAITAAVALALMTAASSAQNVGVGSPSGMGGGGHKGKQQNDKKDTAQKPKVDEKAYSAALKSIPDKPYDPWGKVR